MSPHIIPSPRHVYTQSPTTRPPVHASACLSVSAFVPSRTCSTSSKGQQAHPAPQCHTVLIPGKSSRIPPCLSCHILSATGELVSPSSMWAGGASHLVASYGHQKTNHLSDGKDAYRRGDAWRHLSFSLSTDQGSLDYLTTGQVLSCDYSSEGLATDK